MPRRARISSYTFDNLTAQVAGLIDQLGLTSYILYMQDYGGPVGFRLFTQHPDRVKGFIIQNANAYLEGVGDMPKQVFLPLWNKRDADHRSGGARLPGRGDHQVPVSGRREESRGDQPRQLDDRPGAARSSRHRCATSSTCSKTISPTRALRDWHAAFRKHQPSTLIVWGKNDPFFIPAGAEAFKHDLPEAKLVWLDAGHFVLDENASTVAAEIKGAFAR